MNDIGCLLTVYVGIAATDTLNQLDVTAGQKLKETCHSLLVELVTQIRGRFVLTDPAYDAMAILCPENARALNPPSVFFSKHFHILQRY